jgi:hypothetical protein
MDRRGNHRVIEHGGAWQGFTTQISRYVDDKLTVIALTNLSGGGPSYIVHAVAGIYEPEVAPKKHTPVELKAEMLQPFAGEYKMEDTGTIIKIAPSGSKLTADLSGQSVELIPESDTSFFVDYSETTYQFEKNNGQVTKMIQKLPDLDRPAKKIK